MLVASMSVRAQLTSISPYSRIGVGDQRFNGFFLNKHLGGFGVALRDSLHVNPLNPASYSALGLTAFEFGVNTERWTLSTDALSEQNNLSYLSHLSLGFPLGKKLGAAFALYPYSNLGYDIQQPGIVDGLGEVIYTYQGEGDVNAFYGGLGYEPFRGFSVGIGVSYLFGTQDRKTSVEFDSVGFYNTRYLSRLRFRNFILDYGLTYTFNTGSINWTMGATYGAENPLSVLSDYSMYTYTSVGGVESVKDSVINEVGDLIDLTFPQNYGIGLALGKKDKWLVGAEYTFSGWSQYRDVINSDTLANRRCFRLGGYWTPDASAPTGFFNKIQYRAGFHYAETPIYLNETHVVDYGTSFGVALPFFARTFSTLNLGVRWGMRGEVLDGLIKEDYFQFNFGLTMNDKWFIKRKID